jgi:hypothetical protein
MMIFPILKQRIIPKPAKNLLDFHHFFIEKIGLLQGRLKRRRNELNLLTRSEKKKEGKGI